MRPPARVAASRCGNRPNRAVGQHRRTSAEYAFRFRADEKLASVHSPKLRVSSRATATPRSALTSARPDHLQQRCKQRRRRDFPSRGGAAIWPATIRALSELVRTVASPAAVPSLCSFCGAAVDRQVAATTRGCVLGTTRVRRRSRRRRGESRVEFRDLARAGLPGARSRRISGSHRGPIATALRAPFYGTRAPVLAGRSLSFAVVAVREREALAGGDGKHAVRMKTPGPRHSRSRCR